MSKIRMLIVVPISLALFITLVFVPGVNSRPFRLGKLPDNRFFFVKIEDLDYNKFVDLIKFLEAPCHINEKQFNKIKNSRPGKASKKHINPWKKNEQIDLLNETKHGIANRSKIELGIENRI